MPISAAFPFESQFANVLGSKMHYVDEGAGDPILFLHGNPTWCYLWRNIVPYVSPLGRCIAPDLIGMGRSDSPDIPYRFADHARYLQEFIETLDLERITLVIHDWGSALGFDFARQFEGKIKGIAFLEAIMMAAPSWDVLPESVQKFQRRLRTQEGFELVVRENIFIEQILPSQVLRELSAEEMAYYRAPYLDSARRKPLLQWPREVPIGGEPQDVLVRVNAYNQWLQTSLIPKLLLDANPGSLIGSEMAAWCREHLRALTIFDCGQGLHFPQEDSPDELGAALAEWYATL